MAQSKSTRLQSHKSQSKAQSSMVTKWMDDCYVLGFVPALKYLWSQILHRLYKSPSDETIIKPRSRVCVCMQKDHKHTLKDPAAHVRVRWSMQTTKITQQAKQVSES